ncbi:uncharacterized protein [Diadema setosum]|uniref:uncharacterized protein n=1 Tax=Diadema setosum TaxID=31175 RepID=UPI003B3B1C63
MFENDEIVPYFGPWSIIAAITETWFSETNHADANLMDGYNLFHKDRSARRGGGVALYVRNDIPATIYGIDLTPVHNIVKDVCEAMWPRLQPLYMPEPSQKMLEEIAEGFQRRWNFPHCIGAIDGKHVIVQSPPNSGSIFYNYKGTYSQVLLALVDHDYCFTAVDIGAYGSQSDGGIFAASELGKSLNNGRFPFPNPTSLPEAQNLGQLPFVMVEDEAFPLKTNIMRPYPGKQLPDEKCMYNYRLSRSRRVVENTFGILASKWRIYHRQIQLHPSQVDSVVKATCVLHNFIRRSALKDERRTHTETDTNDARPCHSLQNIQSTGNHASKDALAIREKFTEYFSSPAGAVSWQTNACFGKAK